MLFGTHGILLPSMVLVLLIEPPALPLLSG